LSIRTPITYDVMELQGGRAHDAKVEKRSRVLGAQDQGEGKIAKREGCCPIWKKGLCGTKDGTLGMLAKETQRSADCELNRQPEDAKRRDRAGVASLCVFTGPDDKNGNSRSTGQS